MRLRTFYSSRIKDALTYEGVSPQVRSTRHGFRGWGPKASSTNAIRSQFGVQNVCSRDILHSDHRRYQKDVSTALHRL